MTLKLSQLFILIFSAAIFTCFTGCTSKKSVSLFTSIAPARSEIDFENSLTETEQINLITNEYTYMGGGVGIGDFNNDGLQDIFFTANQISCRLYINKGGFSFEDITKKAGLTTSQWCTGVSITDINNDGWQDIYISISGPVPSADRKNLLFINNHDLTFTEMAAAYGLDDDSHSTQAAFLDYDKDGWVDMFLLTHQMQGESMNKIIPKVLDGSSPRNDRLFRNEGIDSMKGHPVFKNITLPAGIRDDGYGLGVVVSDFNGDNWPDVYVSNDYIGNDCMWLNNKDGSFTNSIARSLNHQSYSSMGTDAADINNDGLPDITTLDMMPEDNLRKKMMYSILNNERHQLEKNFHYEPSFMQNTLQLNRGIAKVNDTLTPVFSDIGYYSGMAETDWSWSILAADFNNDGFKDLHITNGMGRDMINSDFVNFRSGFPNRNDRNSLLLQHLKTLGTVPLSNYLYINNHYYTFSNESVSAGIHEKAISSGAAYADLDNDGDLDLVVNNINAKAFLFSNNSIEQNNSQHNFIIFRLKGPEKNKDGKGCIIKCFINDSVLLLEQNPVRGYLSSMDNRLFTGLGEAETIDSVLVTWPDNRQQVLKDVKANQLLEVDYKNAGQSRRSLPGPDVLFSRYASTAGIHFKHADPFFFDYYFQRLLPQKFSSPGPGLAVGDVNKDGLHDFFIGNGYALNGSLFIQQANGKFKEKKIDTEEKYEEDTGCVFFDADGDGDEDLLVTSGTNEFDKGSPYYLPRLYINDGSGNFARNSQAIPQHLTTVTSVVKSLDWDGDGDLDLFLGGRISTGNYPAAPPSYLLQNNQGIFSDVTASLCPALSTAGMVTDALFADIDGDNMEELIITGEWMPVRIFKNQKSRFTEITTGSGIEELSGMWRSIAVADLDNDGDNDLVVGNMGLNNKFQFSNNFPLNLWYTDIDGNGSTDPLLGYYIPSETGKRELYTAKGLGDLAEQVPALKKKYLYNQDFAVVKMENVFEGLQPVKLQARISATCWFENSGAGRFIKHELPAEAQFAPVNCILVADYNKDGRKDILIAGNEYQNEVMTGNFDAGYGLLLLGEENKKFKPISHQQSGIFLRGDTRSMRMITIKDQPVILAGVNNEALQMFMLKKN